ncbi:MAG: hypothetical protein ACLU9S_11245 [Oscillospiraceae bacterium]
MFSAVSALVWPAAGPGRAWTKYVTPRITQATNADSASRARSPWSLEWGCGQHRGPGAGRRGGVARRPQLHRVRAHPREAPAGPGDRIEGSVKLLCHPRREVPAMGKA